MAVSGEAAAVPGPLSHLEQARLDLARISLTPGRPPEEAFGRLAELAADALSVSRVSIWRFLDNRNSIRCEHLHQAAPRGSWEGAILHRRDFPGYFEAIESRRVVAVSDTEEDPFSVEFREAYFKPLGIRSMLDCPVYKAGQPIGIVCHEQMERVRKWTPEEREFAGAVGDAFARITAEAEGAAAQLTLDALQNRFEQLETMSALGRLAAGIAHDFRNILGTARGYVELLSEGQELNPAGRARMQELGAVLQSGERLTRELTAFGHAEPAKPQVMDLGEFLGRFQGMLAMAAGPGVGLRLERETGVAPVFMDAGQMERILLNLVLNAKDAMPEGGTLSLRLRRSVSPKSSRMVSMTLLEVEDTGTGMDRDTMRRIFEPYFTTKGEKGTGLGLAIVNQGVVQAGGQLEVDSEPGKGTVFRIFLPGIASSRDSIESRVEAGPALDRV